MAERHPESIVRRVVELWEQQLSSGQIAIELGLVSRNVVIGIIDRARRAGLVLRKRNGSPQQPTAPRAGKPPPPRPELPPPRAVPVESKPIPFIDRTMFQCAWIVDGRAPDGLALCCGVPVSAGSWCAMHYKRVMVKPVGRRHAIHAINKVAAVGRCGYGYLRHACREPMRCG